MKRPAFQLFGVSENVMARKSKPNCAAIGLALVLLSLLLPRAEAAGISLVAGGEPKASIVVGRNAGALTRRASTELQSYVRQISGARVPEVTDADAASRPAAEPIILLGSADQNSIVRELIQAGELKAAGLKREGFVIKTLTWKNHPTVVIAGADDAGSLYGTYELLERLGVTFRLTGDIVPTNQPALVLTNLDVRMEPALQRRGFLLPVTFDNVSSFSYSDYERLLDQMARMKCNYLQFWWFAYAPWVKFSYKGEAKWMGDVSTKESGYQSWFANGFGSRTSEDISIGREHFKDRPRLAPLEMQHVETPEQAFEVCQNLLQRVIAHAAKRNIKVWLAVELAALPPNLARHCDIVGEAPFHPIFGTFVHPLDPVNREIQVNRLKALVENYPQAEGIFFNFAELYPSLATNKYVSFFEEQRPRFQELRPLCLPWFAALVNLYDVKIENLVDSNIGHFDLFSYLLKKRDEVAPGTKIGLMTVGRAYALPLFNKMLPEDVPFASLESSGVWTMMNMPMEYFGGMGQRERIIQPRVDDDFDMLGMQFSVRQYAEKDRIFVDGVKHGLSGVAGQLDRARGTEFNSSFLARAAWEPGLTTEQFYRECAERMFGRDAAQEMYQAFMKLEENQTFLGYYGFEGGYGLLPCCGSIWEVNATYQFARQKNPYAGPVAGSWKRLMTAASDGLARREGSARLLNDALGHLRAASPKVSPHAQYELGYLINRTEAFRDCLLAMNTVRRGMQSFDQAFQQREKLGHEAFCGQLERSLATVREGAEQMKQATRKYSEIVDHVSDLAVLYHVNVRLVFGTELITRFLQDVANYHLGKPYLQSVPFERLYNKRMDKETEE